MPPGPAVASPAMLLALDTRPSVCIRKLKQLPWGHCGADDAMSRGLPHSGRWRSSHSLRLMVAAQTNIVVLQRRPGCVPNIERQRYYFSVLLT